MMSTAIAPLEAYLSEAVPGGAVLVRIASLLASLMLLTLLFAVIFHQLPDVSVAWRDVWMGAAFTALLFALGKAGFGWYLGRASVASAYGAAGSFVVLLWIYYSALIFLFGAEFTQVYARRRGTSIRPASYARRIGDGGTEGSGVPAEPVSTPAPAPSGGWGRRLGLVALGFLMGRYFGSRR